MNLRKDAPKSIMKKWLATPPGRIARPLKYIKNHVAYGDKSLMYQTARIAADFGNGAMVHSIAMRLLTRV